MDVWGSYQKRVQKRGNTRREQSLQREQQFLQRKLSGSLSYKTVVIDGVEREVIITSSDNLAKKTICAMPNETLVAGSLLRWGEDFWIITELDPDCEVYTRGFMLRCNYFLKWMNNLGKVVERWSIVVDGTSYLAGETVSSYAGNGMSLGDTRISLVLPRDTETVKLSRENRFLIDDPLSEAVLSYRLTKPFKVGGVYNGHGVMSFILTEVNTEQNDNLDLMIADYYKYFPREKDGKPHEEVEKPPAHQGHPEGDRLEEGVSGSFDEGLEEKPEKKPEEYPEKKPEKKKEEKRTVWL